MSGLLTHPAVESLARALLHSLWIGGLVALAVALMMVVIPARRASVRHAICFAGMVAVLLGGMTAWVIELRPAGEDAADVSVAGVSETTISQVVDPIEDSAAPRVREVVVGGATGPRPELQVAAATDGAESSTRLGWHGLVAALWALGALVFLVGNVRAVSSASRIASLGRVGEYDELVQRLRDFAVAHGFHRVRIVVVESLGSPAVVGAIRPVVLMPSLMLTGMPPEVIRAALAHELAHVRRHDYLFNLIQMAVESLLFFNPAIWWMGRRARIEREAAADARALSMLDADPADYARALASVADASLGGALAFAGPRGGLVERVRRLLIPGYRPELRAGWGTTLSVVGGVLVAIALVFQGTAATVAAAAQYLSHGEVIERLAEGEARSDEGNARSVSVEGRLILPDGAGLDRDHMVVIRSGNRRTFPSIDRETLTFSQQIQGQEVYAGLHIPGFRPTVVGPFEPNKDGVVSIDVALEPSVPISIQVINRLEEPINDAQVRVSWNPRPESPMSLLGMGSFDSRGRSSMDGIVTFEGTDTGSIQLLIEAPGYVREFHSLDLLQGNELYQVVLADADEIKGRVVSEVTGEPLQGAEVRLGQQWRAGATRSSVYPKSAPLLAETDEDGEFVISSLDPAWNSQVWFMAEDHLATYLVIALAEERDDLGTIRLRHPIMVSGVSLSPVVHDMSVYDYASRRHQTKPAVSLTYQSPSILGNRGIHYDSTVIPAERSQQEGEDGEPLHSFQFFIHVPGRYTLGTTDFDVVDSDVTDLNVDMGHRVESREEEPSETIRYILDLPPDAPAPRGRLAGAEIKMLDDGRFGVEIDQPSRDRRVAWLRPDELIGYWFPPNQEDELDASNEFVVRDVVPAGHISSKLRSTSGLPQVGFVTYLSTGGPAYSGFMPGPNSGSHRSEFRSGPIPFGSPVRVVASFGNYVMVSEDITITSSEPLVELVFERPDDGIDVVVRVENPDADPLSVLMVELHFEVFSGFHKDGRMTVHQTNREGEVHLKGINPNLLEHYRLVVSPDRSYMRQEALLTGDPLQVVTLRYGLSLEGSITYEETGEPVRNARVLLLYTEYDEYKVVEADSYTDEEGRFVFTRAMPGSVELRVFELAEHGLHSKRLDRFALRLVDRSGRIGVRRPEGTTVFDSEGNFILPQFVLYDPQQ